MKYMQPQTKLTTHEVMHQVPPLANINAYENDLALKEAVCSNGAAWTDETTVPPVILSSPWRLPARVLFSFGPHSGQ